MERQTGEPTASALYQRRRRVRLRLSRKALCSACGAAFFGKRRDTRYCSDSCRQRDYRRRKWAKAAAAGEQLSEGRYGLLRLWDGGPTLAAAPEPTPSVGDVRPFDVKALIG